MDARSLIILEDSRDLGTLRKDFRKSCKSASGSSLKRSKKAVHKRVVTVPIGNLEGSRQKGETPPPPDSWTWRKYGQKPIKGSPYPRGYYRCSSSKGCPARKQVERSHLDPTMLSVTYSSDHNHPLTETSRVPHHAGIAENFSPPEEPKKPEPTPELDVDAVKFELDGSKLMGHDPGWFSDMEDSVLLPETLEIEDAEHRCFKNDSGYSGGSGGREFDDHEDFFADLGELPESTVVFR